MKKVARILGLACMVGMIAFTSCKKKEQNAMTISVSTPELTVDEEDRAYIKPNYTFMWEQDDVIKVYNLDATPANSLSRIFHNVSGAGPRANFQGPNVGTARSEGYRFFYPVIDLDGVITAEYLYFKLLVLYCLFIAANSDITVNHSIF